MLNAISLDMVRWSDSSNRVPTQSHVITAVLLGLNLMLAQRLAVPAPRAAARFDGTERVHALRTPAKICSTV